MVRDGLAILVRPERERVQQMAKIGRVGSSAGSDQPGAVALPNGTAAKNAHNHAAV